MFWPPQNLGVCSCTWLLSGLTVPSTSPPDICLQYSSVVWCHVTVLCCSATLVQVTLACEQLRELDELDGGWNAVGFSQGGQFLRVSRIPGRLSRSMIWFAAAVALSRCISKQAPETPGTQQLLPHHHKTFMHLVTVPTASLLPYHPAHQ
jgi:hypothetical protein